MSTKITLQYHAQEDAGFHLYSECLDEPIEYVYLELSGIPFEAEASTALSGNGPSRVAVRIPVKWAPDLILGFQKAMVETFVPIKVRNRAREVFEDDDAARAWLIAKPFGVGGKSAVELCMEGNADVVLNEIDFNDGRSWAQQ